MGIFEPFYTVFARIGFTDPFHPTLVHMPIGLVVGALIFLAVALISNRPGFATSARYCLVLSWLFLFPTVLVGVMDWLQLYHGAWLLPLKVKMGLAAALFVLLTYAIILIYRGEESQKKLLVVNVLALVLVVALGYFGGRLVFGGRGPVATPELAAGRNIFILNCASCHPGGSNKIMPDALVLGSDNLKNSATFLSWIRDPRLDNGAKGPMPDFTQKDISDQRAQELYAYVKKEFGKPGGSKE